MTGREKAIRLAGERSISDPKHGLLGTIQKTKDGWKTVGANGESFGCFPIKRHAINRLCDAAGIPKWFS